jgi:hypothetical protein
MHAVHDAAAFACGDEGFGDGKFVGNATATVFAAATASATAYCKASGDANFKVDISAESTQEVETWLTAYAQSVAEAGICNVCDSYVHSWGYISQEIFLRAYAVAAAKVCL